MPKFQGQTGQILKIKLPSSIVSARWGENEVAAGGRVMLEVLIQWVSGGSDIEIKVMDLEGGTVETVKGKVYGDFYRIQYPVTKPNKTGGMYFEAELKAHGLKAVGPKIKVWPPVEISGLEWADEKGKAVQNAGGEQILTLRAKVKSAARDLNAAIAVFRDLGRGETRVATLGPYPVKDGKIEAKWAFKMPHAAMENLDRRESNPEPRPKPAWHFKVSCLGTTARSPDLIGEEDLRLVFESKSKGRPKEIEIRHADGRKETLKAESGEA